MTIQMNARNLAAGLMFSAWLGFAGNAQAGIIIIEDPFSAADEVVYASYRECPAGHLERLDHLLKRLRAKPGAPTLSPAAPTTAPAMLVSQADLAPPAHLARVSAPAGAVLVVGVAF